MYFVSIGKDTLKIASFKIFQNLHCCVGYFLFRRVHEGFNVLECPQAIQFDLEHFARVQEWAHVAHILVSEGLSQQIEGHEGLVQNDGVVLLEHFGDGFGELALKHNAEASDLALVGHVMHEDCDFLAHRDGYHLVHVDQAPVDIALGQHGLQKFVVGHHDVGEREDEVAGALVIGVHQGPVAAVLQHGDADWLDRQPRPDQRENHHVLHVHFLAYFDVVRCIQSSDEVPHLGRQVEVASVFLLLALVKVGCHILYQSGVFGDKFNHAVELGTLQAVEYGVQQLHGVEGRDVVGGEEEVNDDYKLVPLAGAVLEEPLKAVNDGAEFVFGQLTDVILQIVVEVYEAVLFELYVAQVRDGHPQIRVAPAPADEAKQSVKAVAQDGHAGVLLGGQEVSPVVLRGSQNFQLDELQQFFLDGLLQHELLLYRQLSRHQAGDFLQELKVDVLGEAQSDVLAQQVLERGLH